MQLWLLGHTWRAQTRLTELVRTFLSTTRVCRLVSSRRRAMDALRFLASFTVRCFALEIAMPRFFLLSAAGFLLTFSPVTSHAQEQLDAKAATLILSEYRIDLALVHDKLMALADSIPADKFAFRPSADVRTVSEVLMHVVGEWFYICPISIGAKPPADFGVPRESMPALEKITEKAEVLEQLKKSWAFCTAALASADANQLRGKYEPAKMTLARAVMRVGGDQHEHLGQLITYARAVGVKPVWSK
jgi:uncharacterized damage-inducible protein DinB